MPTQPNPTARPSAGHAQPVPAATHTPGPWRYCRISNLGDYAITGPNDDGTNDIVRGTIGDGAFSLENARLIAAAPALLAALNAIDRLAGCQSDSFADLSLAMGECRSVARAALDMAKGAK